MKRCVAGGNCRVFDQYGYEVSSLQGLKDDQMLFLVLPDRLFVWPGFHVGHKVGCTGSTFTFRLPLSTFTEALSLSDYPSPRIGFELDTHAFFRSTAPTDSSCGLDTRWPCPTVSQAFVALLAHPNSSEMTACYSLVHTFHDKFLGLLNDASSDTPFRYSVPALLRNSKMHRSSCRAWSRRTRSRSSSRRCPSRRGCSRSRTSSGKETHSHVQARPLSVSVRPRTHTNAFSTCLVTSSTTRGVSSIS